MRRFLIVLVLIAAAAGGYWWVKVRPEQQAAAGAATAQGDAGGRRGGRGGGRGGGGREGGGRDQAIPVVVAAAATRDVPIYLDGLGTAQASATVTVHVQVDGTLQEVRVREGQDVHVGDVIARIDPRLYQAALDQAVAKKAQDQANLANARVDLVRYQKLAATAYTSAQQSDTQKATVAQLEAQVAQDQAQIDTARTNLSYTTVTAPVDGRVGLRLVDAGNIVHTSDSSGVVVITTLHPIAVVFSLPQQNLPLVTAAMALGPPVAQALPQGDGGTVLDQGTLAVVDNQVDSSTGTIKLKAYFPNARLQLWPGAFLTVRLLVDTRRDATTVPPVAVQRGPQGPYVYVVANDDTAARRLVKVGHEDQSASIVEDGLKPGERVVVDGASRLTDKVKVTIAQPAGTPPAGARPADAPAAGSRPGDAQAAGTQPGNAQPSGPAPAAAASGERRRRRPDGEAPGTASRSGNRGDT